jgi:predicted RNA-binding protein with TRAM domain
MRNIDKSDWLEKPELEVVEVKKNSDGTARMSEFTVFAKGVKITKEEEES